MIAVVSVYTPRPDHRKWRDYLTGMALERDTAQRWGARHVVVTDVEMPDFETMRTELPQSLMKAQIAGQIAYLEQWSNDHHVLLVDADCLIARDPAEAFCDRFDLGLTWRDNPACMINNGAMYIVAGSKERVLPFFRHALALCKDHWGGDQEAISAAAAPVPKQDGKRGERQGAMVEFMSMRTHNCVPTKENAAHREPVPFVVHFKGEHRKDWMRAYAENFILRPA